MNDAHSEPPDEELIRRIRQKEQDRSSADQAFLAFYERHVQFVFRCVRHADRQLVGYGIGTDDIVEETFENVWCHAADTFTMPAGLSPDDALLRTRRWLAAIARNLVKDKLKSRKHILPIDPTGENEGLFGSKDAAADVASHLRVIQVVADVLSKRDVAIVWFKIQYYDPETKQSQPPQEELDVFCREWDITPAALRKAYERALTTIGLALTQQPLTLD